jgi:CHASE2 domain-containing sensor protein
MIITLHPISLGETVMFGVEINAQIIDQIISAALDDRPFIQAAPEYLETLWILAWTAAGAIAAALFANTLKKLAVLIVFSDRLNCDCVCSIYPCLVAALLPSNPWG